MKKELFAITLLLSFYMMACGTKENVNPVETKAMVETEVETTPSETIDVDRESYASNLLQERYADVNQLEIKEESEVHYSKDFVENNAESVQITEVNTKEDAVDLVKEQVIQAYENVYGPYEPSDVEPTFYSDDSERLAYIIPRLAVSEETDEYYVIPVVWDFRVYKESGRVTVYYNGIDPMEYTFDPTNPNHLAFAG